jgi:predicted MFS family arabinose efflux permease
LISTMLVVLVLVAGNTPNWVIPLVVLMAGLTYPLSFGGFTSFIPVLVPDELLPPANALETTSFNSALVIGPALAGTLSGAFGPATSLLVEAGLALVALVLILRIPDLDRGGDRGDGRTLLGVAAAGIRQIVSVPELRGITVAAAIGLGGLGLMTVTFPLFAVEHLGGQRSDAGFMWAAFAVGSTLGALSLVRLQRRVPPERIVLAGYAIFGTLMLTWPLAGTLPALLVLIGVAGLADGPALAAQFAVRQQVVPPSLYGQVFTTAAGLKVGSFAMGAGLAGPVVTGLGSAEAMLVAAVAQMVAAVVGVTLMRMPARALTQASPGA